MGICLTSISKYFNTALTPKYSSRHGLFYLHMILAMPNLTDFRQRLLDWYNYAGKKLSRAKVPSLSLVRNANMWVPYSYSPSSPSPPPPSHTRSYCLNIMFYLRLKSCNTPVQSHPVIGRIVQIRQVSQPHFVHVTIM